MLLYALSGFISLLRIQHTYYHRLQLYYLIVVSLTTICALEFIFQVDPTCVSAAGVWDEAMRMNGQCCCVDDVSNSLGSPFTTEAVSGSVTECYWRGENP